MKSIFSFRSDPSLSRQNFEDKNNEASNVVDQSSVLRSILNQLNHSSSDILSSALISTDGLVIASSVLIQLDEDVIGAMSAAMVGIGARISEEFKRGAIEQVLVKGEDGYVLLTHAGNDNVLSVITNSRAKLGLIFMECKKCSEALAKSYS